ncbi:MAG: ribosomal protein S18-alanine N-acetyltransferase [Clostridiales bacterium]|jgi:ribosomal-protein-alanine N-acetyltransferase|nr:ribosomal protein S18-alanine N-acetyltransferase [Clostridiales bacterium]
MNVREIGTEQLDRVEELETLCFSVPWSRETLVYSIEDPTQRWLGCFEGEKLIGYLNVQFVADEGYVGNVAVDPGYRNRGAGIALMDELDRYASEHNIEKLMLEVRENNAPAIALYEKSGFERVGFRPGYYDSPREGAVLMTKFLNKGEKNDYSGG